MKCPKCTGLLIREDIREQSGRFQGWRCIQCGFRLDHLIAQNRTATPPDPADDDTVETSPRAGSTSQRRTTSRNKRAASKA
ncbi:MAG: hypothetical protein A3H49_09410 [Nitrospirae bacterium RIFCSPLOWO2_02_FULL_62_14]|nr:MAG: hypothetical protein A3H49_09410 [Nitrospirae bacterium RIFCSPLOWO2_02_FULL_62_14]OGW70481.1 MAG: hypothetical protein A3A88_02255 [Nitrospirae bacterium RIFCSPLOWO2_01_FULL_62_17]OGX12053.1 MAG: hypothetical protein A3K11_11235 [Nitrospirae bacterium RIFCSPLOWO2_12_FULL_63_8]